MLPAILTLMALQLIGEAVRDAFSVPIPGPVIGMFLLAAVLVIRRRRMDPVPSALEATAETLISHMGLLFVPAGVGIIAEADLLRQEWLPVVAAVVGSTVLSLAVTGLVLHAVLRLSERRQVLAVAVSNSEVQSC